MIDEIDQAKQIANDWLDGKMNPLVQMVPDDADCDAMVLARQFIRTCETLFAAQQAALQEGLRIQNLRSCIMKVLDERLATFSRIESRRDLTRESRHAQIATRSIRDEIAFLLAPL